MKKYLLISCMVILSFGLDFAPARGEIPRRKNGFNQKYGILVERNIFSRNRTRKTDKRDKKPKNIVQRYAHEEFVLRGISRWSKEYVAFLENTSYSQTKMYRIGDSVAEGKIKNITLDYVEFEIKKNVKKVEIGKNLQGEIYTPSVTFDDLDLIDQTEILSDQVETSFDQAETSSEPATTTDSNAGAESSEEQNDILKKLLERRKKELQ